MLNTVEGACDRAPFYHVLCGSAGFCLGSLGGQASLRNTGYRGVVGKSWCVVGVGGFGWCKVGSFGERWSGTLSASFI